MKFFSKLMSKFKRNDLLPDTSNEDAQFSEHPPIDLNDYSDDDFSRLSWLARNVPEWNGGNYNYITALKCDNSSSYKDKYTPMYAKRPRNSDRYFSKDEWHSMRKHLGEEK